MPESLGCQIGVTAKAGSHLHPRYKQMKDVRPFEEIRAEQGSDGVRDQTRLSILSWNAGLKRFKATHSVVGSYHLIPLQETRSNSTSFRVDQVIMFHNEPGGVKTEGEIPGTSKQDSFLPEVHTCLCSSGQHDREEARNCKRTSGPDQGFHGAE